MVKRGPRKRRFLGRDPVAAQKFLARLRENLGLGAREAAQAVGISETAWRNYEKGDVPTTSTIEAIDEKLVKRRGSGFEPGAAAAHFLPVGDATGAADLSSFGEFTRPLSEAGFSAERHDRDSDPDVVLWMHRLREPNLVHGVFALCAAAAIRSDIDVRLLLDDTGVREGNRAGLVKNFCTAVDQWLASAHADPGGYEVERYSQILVSATATQHGAELLSRYLTAETPVMEFLEASKVIPPRRADRTRGAELQAMASWNPSADRMRTPFWNWAVLDHEVRRCAASPRSGRQGTVLTLGGEDERVLWRIWRRGTDPALADATGHLYLTPMPLYEGTPWEFGALTWGRKNYTALAKFIEDEVTAAEGDPAMAFWVYRAGVQLPVALNVGEVAVGEAAARLLDEAEGGAPSAGDDLRLVAREIAKAVVRWFAQP